jgi:hypothetical protein
MREREMRERERERDFERLLNIDIKYNIFGVYLISINHEEVAQRAVNVVVTFRRYPFFFFF